jgi:type IV pilus assembly protein PilY1
VQPATAQTQAVITNGTVTLGVNQEGHLLVADPDPTQSFGVRLNATGHDGLRGFDGIQTSVPLEGWGVAVPGTPIDGYVNHGFIPPLYATESFQMIPSPLLDVAPDRAKSQVVITDGVSAVLRVTHEWTPTPPESFTPFLYQAIVTIENLTGSALGSGPDGLRYRRVMDWDAEPTPSTDFISIGGLSPTKPAFVRFTSDDGFETSDPLTFASLWFSGLFVDPPVDQYQDQQALFGVPSPLPCSLGFPLAPGDFTNCGFFDSPFVGPFVADHGALFDFAFPALAPQGVCEDPVNGPCDTRTFVIFYGAAPTRQEAREALSTVRAEVYSLANCQGIFSLDGIAPVPP